MDISRMFKLCWLVLLAALVASAPLHAREKVAPQLAILPFSLNGSDDLAYLKEGVRTMLASRIASRAEVKVLDRVLVEKAVAAQIVSDPATVATYLAADLVLTGSITTLGASVSIDAQLLVLATGDAKSFFAAAENQSGVIGVVDKLALDIAAHISGAGLPVRADVAAQVSPPSADPSLAPDSQHPDRLFMLAAPAPGPVVIHPATGDVAGPGSGLVAPLVLGSPLSATRSQFLDLEVQVMDVGDVFGEGGDRIILAEKQRITVYRWDGNRLVLGGEVPAAPRHVRIIALNLADLNGNGRAEIYISAISDNSPLSYAVEWDGRNFVKLFDKQRHYLRPLHLPGTGWGLYGQQADLDGPVKPGIYKADSFTGALLTEEKLTVPEAVNLFEFVMGDFTGDGRLETAVQTQNGDLFLYNSDNEVLWNGSGKYGSTSRYIGPAYSGRLNGQTNLQVPTRLAAFDLNGDGRQELVAMANPVGVSARLKTVGNFIGGSIKIMAWNGVTFVDLWSSGEIGSYIASYQLNGAEPRLYLAMLSKKSGFLFNSLQSVVASYSLAAPAR